VRVWFTRRSRLRHRRHERGTTLIEFALVFPILVAILFGMIDAGRFIAARAMLSQAAAVGVRTACLSSSTGRPDVDTAVAAAAMTLSGISVQWPLDCIPAGAGCTSWPKARGSTLVLTIQYNFQSGFYKSLTKTMTQTSRMVCE
jgi:Flp pilus assembly protein TadG